MEEQISSNQPPAQQETPSFQIPIPFPGITPAMLEQMKMRAREEAIRLTMEQKAVPPSVPPQYAPQPPSTPNVVYVRRNLTVAEMLLILLLACGIVTGVQVAFSTLTNLLPRIEVKMK